ncbi:hypothetical protein MRX96_031231 [Rhipicephalus microplus]
MLSGDHEPRIELLPWLFRQEAGIELFLSLDGLRSKSLRSRLTSGSGLQAWASTTLTLENIVHGSSTGLAVRMGAPPVIRDGSLKQPPFLRASLAVQTFQVTSFALELCIWCIQWTISELRVFRPAIAPLKTFLSRPSLGRRRFCLARGLGISQPLPLLSRAACAVFVYRQALVNLHVIEYSAEFGPIISWNPAVADHVKENSALKDQLLLVTRGQAVRNVLDSREEETTFFRRIRRRAH